MYKIGLGKDVHKFEEGRQLILGDGITKHERQVVDYGAKHLLDVFDL